MSTKATFVLACLLGASLIFSGCSSPVNVPAEESTEPVANAVPDAETLRSWAEALATEELAQLAAAELMYRNKMFEFCLDVGELSIRRAYGKLFRNFRSFTIEDIVRTDSVLRPIRYTIRYDFDLLGTTPILWQPSSAPDLEWVRSDYFFQKFQSDSIVRVYESGADFRPVSTYSPYLERPNYWSYQTNAELLGHILWLREITEGAG